MFFRNATIFTFPVSAFPLDEFDQLLSERRLQPITGLELTKRGFVPPMHSSPDALTYRSGEGIWIAIGGEDRILPPAVIRKRLASKVAEIEQKEGRRLGSRARRRLQDEIVLDLIPRSFIQDYRVDVYLNVRLGICVVDTSSKKAAEAAVSEIRSAVGSFPALPVSAERDPSALMSALFVGEEADGFALGTDVELKSPGSTGAIRASDQDLSDEDLHKHLQNGMQVTRLGLHWAEQVELVFGCDLVMRKLKFPGADVALQESEEPSAVEDHLSAQFALFHGAFESLYGAVATLFALSSAEPLFDKSPRAHADSALEVAPARMIKLKPGVVGQGALSL